MGIRRETIADLQPLSALSGFGEVLVYQGGRTRRSSIANIATYIGAITAQANLQGTVSVFNSGGNVNAQLIPPNEVAASTLSGGLTLSSSSEFNFIAEQGVKIYPSDVDVNTTQRWDQPYTVGLEVSGIIGIPRNVSDNNCCAGFHFLERPNGKLRAGIGTDNGGSNPLIFKAGGNQEQMRLVGSSNKILAIGNTGPHTVCVAGGYTNGRVGLEVLAGVRSTFNSTNALVVAATKPTSDPGLRSTSVLILSGYGNDYGSVCTTQPANGIFMSRHCSNGINDDWYVGRTGCGAGFQVGYAPNTNASGICRAETAGRSYMTILTTGEVGIGKTDPNVALHVATSGSATIKIEGGDTASPHDEVDVKFFNGSTSLGQIGVPIDNNKIVTGTKYKDLAIKANANGSIVFGDNSVGGGIINASILSGQGGMTLRGGLTAGVNSNQYSHLSGASFFTGKYGYYHNKLEFVANKHTFRNALGQDTSIRGYELRGPNIITTGAANAGQFSVLKIDNGVQGPDPEAADPDNVTVLKIGTPLSANSDSCGNNPRVRTVIGCNNNIVVRESALPKVGFGVINPLSTIHVDGSALIEGPLTVAGNLSATTMQYSTLEGNEGTINLANSAGEITGKIISPTYSMTQHPGISGGITLSSAHQIDFKTQKFTVGDADHFPNDVFVVDMKQTSSGSGLSGRVGIGTKQPADKLMVVEPRAGQIATFHSHLSTTKGYNAHIDILAGPSSSSCYLNDPAIGGYKMATIWQCNGTYCNKLKIISDRGRTAPSLSGGISFEPYRSPIAQLNVCHPSGALHTGCFTLSAGTRMGIGSGAPNDALQVYDDRPLDGNVANFGGPYDRHSIDIVAGTGSVRNTTRFLNLTGAKSWEDSYGLTIQANRAGKGSASYITLSSPNGLFADFNSISGAKINQELEVSGNLGVGVSASNTLLHAATSGTATFKLEGANTAAGNGTVRSQYWNQGTLLAEIGAPLDDGKILEGSTGNKDVAFKAMQCGRFLFGDGISGGQIRTQILSTGDIHTSGGLSARGDISVEGVVHSPDDFLVVRAGDKTKDDANITLQASQSAISVTGKRINIRDQWNGTSSYFCTVPGQARLGINTTNAVSALHVNGDAYIAGDIAGVNDIDASNIRGFSLSGVSVSARGIQMYSNGVFGNVRSLSAGGVEGLCISTHSMGNASLRSSISLMDGVVEGGSIIYKGHDHIFGTLGTQTPAASAQLIRTNYSAQISGGLIVGSEVTRNPSGGTEGRNSFSSILGGFKHEMNGDRATIAGGSANVVNANRAFIGAGTQNRVEKNSQYDGQNAVVAGCSNVVRGGFNIIGAGLNNSLSSTFGFIGAGTGNQVLSSIKGSDAIVTGFANNIKGEGYNFIGGGQLNSIADESNAYSFIGGGFGNSLSGCQSFIGTGYSNKIDREADYSFIGGGSLNCITRSLSVYACNTKAIRGGVIIGGEGNCVFNSGGIVVGGYCNRVEGFQSNVVGGCANQILSAGVKPGGPSIDPERSSILGGFSNDIIGSSFSLIGGGSNNIIGQGCNTCYNLIAGGYLNEIGNVNYSSILGGRDNTLSGSADCSFIIGTGINGTDACTLYTNSISSIGDISTVGNLSALGEFLVGDGVNAARIVSRGNGTTLDLQAGNSLNTGARISMKDKSSGCSFAGSSIIYSGAQHTFMSEANLCSTLAVTPSAKMVTLYGDLSATSESTIYGTGVQLLSTLRMSNMPTSSAGLPVGTIYADTSSGNLLRIVL